MMKNKFRTIITLGLVAMMMLSMSVTAFAEETDTETNDTSIEEIMEVYEENEGNGMLLAPNPNAGDASNTDEDPYADDEELQEIFEVYEENEGNGMLLAPNPNADESISEVENSDNVGFFKSIGNFFESIFDFVAGLFR